MMVIDSPSACESPELRTISIYCSSLEREKEQKKSLRQVILFIFFILSKYLYLSINLSGCCGLLIIEIVEAWSKTASISSGRGESKISFKTP